MENLRWILILAGIAILVLLYFSGRQSSSSRRTGDVRNKSDQRDPQQEAQRDPLLQDDTFAQPLDNYSAESEFDNEVMQRPASQPTRSTNDGLESPIQGNTNSISSKIGEFTSKLAPNRKERAQSSNRASQANTAQSQAASKIVTLHVVAPEGELMNGALLLEQFEQRGYHYGDMNIFHSMHDGQTVFSVAKLIMPGTFDINDLDSFQTPGISFILQLPGPVAADVAFEVLLSESHDIAHQLGAMVLDSDRSTLSKQTVQHMREGIHEYMHRQKYFSKVPS